MHPTLLAFGRWPVYAYTVLLELGLLLGLLLAFVEARRVFGKGEAALEVGLWVAAGGILVGRIGLVLAHLRIFAEDWTRIVRIWDGGLSYHGAFLGGLLALVLYAYNKRKLVAPPSFWVLADVLTPGFALAIAFGWAACLMGGCAYGRVGEGFGTIILSDLFGVEAPRYATQVGGLVFALILFAAFWLLRKHWPFSGASFLMYILLYAAGTFLLEFYRGDESVHLGPWRLGQWMDLLLVAAAATLLLLFWKRGS